MQLPPNLEEIVQQLRFLAQIKERSKPCFSDHSFSSVDSYWDRFIRSVLKRESKIDILYNVEKVIARAHDCLESDVRHRELLKQELRNASRGLATLCITYSRCADFCVKMSVLLTRIEMMLR